MNVASMNYVVVVRNMEAVVGPFPHAGEAQQWLDDAWSDDCNVWGNVMKVEAP